MATRILGWIARLGPKFPVLVVLLLATVAWARVGGGESYSGGSSGSSSDDCGDALVGVLIELVFRFLIWLIINHPAIGVPLTLGLIALFIYAQRSTGNATTRRAIQNADAKRKTQVSAASADGWVATLKARDPAFELLPFLDRVQKLWLELQEAWFRRELGPVRRFVSDATYQRLLTQLEILRLQGVRDATVSMEATDLSIIGFEQSAGFDTLHVRVSGKGRDSEVATGATDEQARNAARSASMEAFIEIWSFVRRPDARTRGDTSKTCPQCGAPWEGGATNVCTHCKAVVNSGVFDWTLAEITQGVEHVAARDTVPGLAELLKDDPAFHTEGLEDRASLCFWKWVSAEVTGDATALARVAAAPFVDGKRAEFLARAGGNKRWAREVAVGAVNLIRLDRGPTSTTAHAEVRWSARWGVADRFDRAQDVPVLPKRWVFTLERALTAKTDPARGMSSALCASCGAPLGESTALSCEFCGAALGVAELDWVLTSASTWETWRSAHPISGGAPAAPAADFDERRRMLYALGALATADGALDPKERKQLEACASRWGLEAAEVKAALAAHSAGADPAAGIERQSPEAGAFLSELVQLALVDGRVDRNERKLLTRAAQHLGLETRLGELLKR